MFSLPREQVQSLVRELRIYSLVAPAMGRSQKEREREIKKTRVSQVSNEYFRGHPGKVWEGEESRMNLNHAREPHYTDSKQASMGTNKARRVNV